MKEITVVMKFLQLYLNHADVFKNESQLVNKGCKRDYKVIGNFCQDHQRAQQHKLPKFEKLRMAI